VRIAAPSIFKKERLFTKPPVSILSYVKTLRNCNSLRKIPSQTSEKEGGGRAGTVLRKLPPARQLLKGRPKIDSEGGQNHLE